MDARFRDIFSKLENEIFRVVFFPDRIYHARYLNASVSDRYRYDVDEVRTKSGLLEFRNLFSNYFGFARDQRKLDLDQATELGRRLEAWNPDANGDKGPEGRMEDFLAVDYMDLHSVNPNSDIGIHRHRDNSEVFLMMEGQALMVLGDWCRFPDRERAFEARTLNPGHLALLKGGQLHGLLNLGDQACHLFMFGGYD